MKDTWSTDDGTCRHPLSRIAACLLELEEKKKTLKSKKRRSECQKEIDSLERALGMKKVLQ